MDSTYPGYNISVIDDEIINAFGGNVTTWASTETATPHWVAINFSDNITFENATIWWAWNSNSGQQRYMTSQEVDVQYWNGNNYITVASMIPTVFNVSNSSTSFTPVNTNSIRFWQPANMGAPTYATIIWLTEIDYSLRLSCTLPLDLAPCGVDNAELGNAISAWFRGQITISQLIEYINDWKS